MKFCIAVPRITATAASASSTQRHRNLLAEDTGAICVEFNSPPDPGGFAACPSNDCSSIIIIGGGVAGLSSAVALRRKFPEVDITIIEPYPDGRNASSTSGHGFGMMLMQEGVHALKDLGAAELLLLEKHAQPLVRSLVQESDGTVVVDEEFGEIYSCSREGIINALEKALKKEQIDAAGKVERVCKKCSKIELSDSGDYMTSISFTDGSSIRIQPNDLVVACDGVRSVICSTLNPNMDRPISRVNEVVSSTRAPALARRLGNTFRKVMCVQDGLAYGLLASTSEDVVGFVQFDTMRYDVPTTSEEKRDLFELVVSKIDGNDNSELRKMFEEYVAVADMENTHVWRPINSDLPERLHAKNVVLTGDAAHPLLPFTSQGTSMALEDSIVLADVLDSTTRSSDSLEAGLAEFVGKRAPIAKAFVEQGRMILDGFVNQVPMVPYVLSTKGRSQMATTTKRNGSFRSIKAVSKSPTTSPGESLVGAEGGHGYHKMVPTGVILGVTTNFGSDKVDFDQLKKKSHNYRWATLPEGCIPLTAADSDFPIAEPIQRAIADYIREGYMNYSPAKGLPPLREEIGRMYTVSSERVFITSAAASSMFLLMKHLLKPGDEVIIPDPVDFLFQRSIEAAGGVVRRFKLLPPQVSDPSSGHWSFDITDVEALVSDRTKVIGVCNPHNPIGRVWDRDDLQKLADLAIRHDLKIWSDEVWRDISFVKFTPMMHISNKVADRVYTVYGFSKGYGLAGLRLGCIIAPTAEDIDSISKMSLADDTAYGVSVLSQVAGIAALQEARGWRDEFRAHVESQCRRAVNFLNAIPHVNAVMPEGTFVVFANVSHYLDISGMDEEGLCNFLAASYNVAIVPGSPKFFGPSAAGHVRLAVATSVDVLNEALRRIEEGLHFLLATSSE